MDQSKPSFPPIIPNETIIENKNKLSDMLKSKTVSLKELCRLSREQRQSRDNPLYTLRPHPPSPKKSPKFEDTEFDHKPPLKEKLRKYLQYQNF